MLLNHVGLLLVFVPIFVEASLMCRAGDGSTCAAQPIKDHQLLQTRGLELSRETVPSVGTERRKSRWNGQGKGELRELYNMVGALAKGYLQNSQSIRELHNQTTATGGLQNHILLNIEDAIRGKTGLNSGSARVDGFMEMLGLFAEVDLDPMMTNENRAKLTKHERLVTNALRYYTTNVDEVEGVVNVFKVQPARNSGKKLIYHCNVNEELTGAINWFLHHVGGMQVRTTRPPLTPLERTVQRLLNAEAEAE